MKVDLYEIIRNTDWLDGCIYHGLCDLISAIDDCDASVEVCETGKQSLSLKINDIIIEVRI